MAESPGEDQEAQKLTLVLSDNYGGAEHRGIQVVRDQRSLEKFFARINKTRKPGIPVPRVDFSSQMALIYSGGRMQGSTIPELQTLADTRDSLLLGVRDRGSAQKAGGTATIVPFALYILPNTDKEIILEDLK